jgi:hypothetical protein
MKPLARVGAARVAHAGFQRIYDRALPAGIIDKQLLAGPVHLPHRQTLPLDPCAVGLTERRIAIAVGMLLEIIQVQQFQRDAGALQLGVDPGRIREWRAGRPVTFAP